MKIIDARMGGFTQRPYYQIVDKFKNKYNGEGIIIRIYEKNGVKTKLNLDKTSLKEKNITLVNFIEEEINEEIIDNTLLFKPFEVKTLWVRKDSKN